MKKILPPGPPECPLIFAGESVANWEAVTERVCRVPVLEGELLEG